MFIKKSIIILACFIFALCLCACSNKGANEQMQNNAANTDNTTKTEVSIPTDSGLADSVFDDVSNPTKPQSGEKTEHEESQETVDSTTPSDSVDTTDSVSDATAPNTAPEEMTYEAFTALTPEEQRLYQASFKDLDAFFAWYSAAKEKYEQENPPIDIDGPINLGKL